LATSEEVSEVRQNTDEPNADTWKDEELEDLIDSVGVDGASAVVWRKKAGLVASLVNVSEAGSSQSLGDLQKKYLDMAKLYDPYGATLTVTATGRVRVKLIER
jgi:hypothetical protein